MCQITCLSRNILVDGQQVTFKYVQWLFCPFMLDVTSVKLLHHESPQWFAPVIDADVTDQFWAPAASGHTDRPQTQMWHRKETNINAAVPGRLSLHFFFFFFNQAGHLKLKHLCFSPFKFTARDASCLISCVSGGRKWASRPAHQAGGLEFEHLTLHCQSGSTRQERGAGTEIWHSNRGGKCCTEQPQMCRTKQRAASRR